MSETAEMKVMKDVVPFCSVEGCYRDGTIVSPRGIRYCVGHYPLDGSGMRPGGCASVGGPVDPLSFDQFARAVRELCDGTARGKGYSQSGADGDNPLLKFTEQFFGGHAAGEIVYKAVRFQKKGDPTDLLKIAAWAFLLWRHQCGHSK